MGEKVAPLKIFISWSGDRSKAIAAAFKEWIPAVVQAVRPYYSPSDIDKGSRWSAEISKELEASLVGLICLTKENLNAPWLLFEAGALSKSLEKSRVCPMLFGLEPSDLSGPLVQFQATPFSKDEVHKLIRTINQQLESNALDTKVLDSVFEKWWPELDQKIKLVMEKTVPAKDANLRTEREILEEVLLISRTFATRSGNFDRNSEQETRFEKAPELVETLLEYCANALITANDPKQLRDLLELSNQIMTVIWPRIKNSLSKRLSNRLSGMFEELQKRAEELYDEIPF